MKRDFCCEVHVRLLQVKADMAKLINMHASLASYLRTFSFIKTTLRHHFKNRRRAREKSKSKDMHTLSKNYRLISSVIVFPSPSTHLPKSHEPTPHRSARPSGSCTFEYPVPFVPLYYLAKMSDNEFAIESTDAGASDTIPMEAGQIKKGG